MPHRKQDAVPTSLDFPETRSGAELGARVRRIRKARGWTLQDLADRAGLAVSTISKMERAEISLTYDRFMRLAQGLGLDVGELFGGGAESFRHGTVAVTRAGEATVHETPNYRYEMVASDLAGKHMVPMVGVVKARRIEEFESYISHPGEEYTQVISGRLEIHFEGRETVGLGPGDSVYFDSALGHAYVDAAPEGEETRFVVVCWRPGAGGSGASEDGA